jgi:hypothetical protein
LKEVVCVYFYVVVIAALDAAVFVNNDVAVISLVSVGHSKLVKHVQKVELNLFA